MLASIIGRFRHWIAATLIAGLACGLYGPFLGSPRVFDDWVFFSGQNFSYYATHPFGLGLRLPPYFSLAITEVLIGDLQAHRIVSLAFHVGCALALYKLVYELLRAVSHPRRPEFAPNTDAAWACAAAALFAIHPIAVYGAGYLVQRTILFATLFSLLSIVLFVRGLTRGSHAAAIFVTLLNRWLIGESYEPDYGGVATQLEGVFGHAMSDFSWSLSAVTQAGLFFKYLALWLWPDTRAMSIDVRVDFFQTWSTGWAILKVSAFLGFGVIGLVLLRRGGRIGMAGFGMLFTWVLFLAEFSTARFQEPFVLYRSYLWAPGLLIALAATLSAFPLRAAIGASILAIPLLLYQAHDRLGTFSSSFLLWEDAVAKLPEKPVPWGSRTLYMMAREYAYGGQPQKAIEIAEKCMAQYADTIHCHYARGVIHLLQGQYDLALRYLVRAVELQPDSGIAHHRLGLVLENLGRTREAKAEYRRASDLGFKGADLEIRRLESSSAGLPVRQGTA